MRKPKKEKPKRPKKNKEIINDETYDEETSNNRIPRIGKCSYEDSCERTPMSNGLCSYHYEMISNEMAKTVTSKDSEPMKLSETKNRLEKLINGDE